ncbi:Chromate resistance protein ChrB [Nitrobacter hamburgensis]|uniref:Chromate resistance protein ChrB n=1 Tax=Nitrobacter hamburgensis TaxID=912 RepID=UPI003221EC32
MLLETVGLDHVQEQKVIARFSAERDEAYREFISRCDDFDGEIAKERGNGKFTYAEAFPARSRPAEKSTLSLTRHHSRNVPTRS